MDLPLFGMRFITPEPILTYEYLGYSGGTYPDRYKGGTFGYHHETVSILSHMRGVGGIDNWGSDVETAYHVSVKEALKCRFLISRK